VIPKTIHIIWVGDESRRPDNCIDTWRHRNPNWSLRVWGNDELAHYGWVNARHMKAMASRELNGVADMMRWEILYNEGGFVVDADSVCVHSLDDWLFDAAAVACWENEIARPGLIAAGYVAAHAGNPFIGQIVLDIQSEPTVTDRLAWETVGPLRLTRSHAKYRYTGLTVWPSHFFMPQHFTGIRYEGGGTVYAHQEWASTRRSYDQLHTKEVA
jgi:mannosyltransferase OCH1-like enzyme